MHRVGDASEARDWEGERRFRDGPGQAKVDESSVVSSGECGAPVYDSWNFVTSDGILRFEPGFLEPGSKNPLQTEWGRGESTKNEEYLLTI